MRLNVVLLVVIFLVVAAVEVGLHWWVGTSEASSAAQIHEWYSGEDPHNFKKYNEGLVTFVIPCILMGAAAGSLGFRWPSRTLSVAVLLVSIGIVALYLICAKIIHFGGSLPTSENENLVTGLIKTIALCGFVAYFFRVLVTYAVDGRDITNNLAG